jgi:hypothetical protein
LKCSNLSKSFFITRGESSKLPSNCSYIYEIDKLLVSDQLSHLLYSMKPKGNESIHIKSILLNGYSSIDEILYISCYETANEIRNLIDKCLESSNNDYCPFECSIQCFNDDNNHIYDRQYDFVWQMERPFVYSMSSSVCLSARHANSLIFKSETILTGSLSIKHVDIINTTFNDSFHIKNNGVIGNLYPLPNRFHFSNEIIKDKSRLVFKRHLETNKTIKNQLFNDNGTIILIINALNLIETNGSSLIKAQLYISNSRSELLMNELRIKQLLEPQSNSNFEISNKKDFFLLTWNLSEDLNNYYQLKMNHSRLIKFPINLMVKNELMALLPDTNHLFLMNVNELSLRIDSNSSKFKSSMKCKWYFSNIEIEKQFCNDSSIKFNGELKLKSNDISQQTIILYPAFNRPNSRSFKYFTRLRFNVTYETFCSDVGLRSLNDPLKCNCLPGFSGRFCQNLCPISFISNGDSCTIQCSTHNCIGLLICNEEPMGCSCAPGFTGFDCQKKCPNRFWGPSCQFECNKRCFNGSCDPFNGTCIKCNQNEYGLLCEHCFDGYFGEKCQVT